MSEFIEIDKEGEINVEAIMRQIHEHAAVRRLAAINGLPGMSRRFTGCLESDLYDAFYQAATTYDRMGVPGMSTATSIPILGRLWMAVRRQFHNLVRFYVDQSTVKQVAFNKHLVVLLGEIVKQIEMLPTADQVTELHHEIGRLREALSGLAQDREDG